MTAPTFPQNSSPATPRRSSNLKTEQSTARSSLRKISSTARQQRKFTTTISGASIAVPSASFSTPSTSPSSSVLISPALNSAKHLTLLPPTAPNPLPKTLLASNPDLTSATWKALYWYAAAHENTVCDVSQIAHASTLHAENSGPIVWISPGKHASYLNQALCEKGCGADRCENMTALAPAKLINLGEATHPMNGSVFIAPSPAWPLAAKMTATNFPPSVLARLSGLPDSEIVWFNAGKHPKQGIIAISSTTGRDALAGLDTAAGRHGQLPSPSPTIPPAMRSRKVIVTRATRSAHPRATLAKPSASKVNSSTNSPTIRPTDRPIKIPTSSQTTNPANRLPQPPTRRPTTKLRRLPPTNALSVPN